MFAAGKKIATTCVDLLTRLEELEEASAGDKWAPTPTHSDFRPPVDLRWPEYVQTVGVEEW